MELTYETAQEALNKASAANPGLWIDHSRFVAQACNNIATKCPDLSKEKAYLYGLLHDTGYPYFYRYI